VTIRISKWETPWIHKANISLIKVKSCNMLLTCIFSYLKSVLGYKFLILGTYHLDTIYMSKVVRICGHISKPEGFCEQKMWGILQYTIPWWVKKEKISETLDFVAGWMWLVVQKEFISNLHSCWVMLVVLKHVIILLLCMF